MTWRERLALLLGAASPFAISDHSAAATPNTLLWTEGGDEPVSLQPLEFWNDPAHTQHLLQLAGHRSHSSHSSHSSHRSHVSGSGGHGSHYSGTPSYTPSYTPVLPVAPAAPKPVATPAPRPAPSYQPSSPSTLFGSSPVARPSTPAPPPSAAGASSGLATGSAGQAPQDVAAGVERLSQDDISRFVQRVQIALMIKGYDPGPADGVLSPKTREALRAFQTAGGLTVSGNMDMATLHALGVLK
ncbi:peptidoglycan-binding protein [Phenylobacterium sp. NIBR 498073]|uniref:peptidoglycan-binding protein n=1 Tax=Phenylobacterium sp. NIBR 498073 TaxID=3015177 RepID=UPI0022B4A379|nr:peptidoglycan-binding protein [Phenylobacterium sp. NIBR 498073]WGU39012.1 peptidoglycan-binding protein [Phenylobacterium sp. NIBR 498073]